MPDRMHPVGTPVAEHAIDESLVSGLLAAQHADLSQLPLRAVDEGWDNAMFRLGEGLAVRLPRRAAAAALITHEQRWLPHLSKHLPWPVPAPVRVGQPALGYPWSWSVVPWLKGHTADRIALPEDQAVSLARFLRSLHVAATEDAPRNPFRGGPLVERAATTEASLQRLDGRTALLTPRIKRIWQEALETPIDVPATWLHGDLHPRNVLVSQGAISGIIDWGDLTAGDCATDLASVWMLFAEPRAQQKALDEYAHLSPATVRRAKGWALRFGVMFLETGLADHSIHAALGERILRQL